MDAHITFPNKTSEHLWSVAMWGLALVDKNGRFLKVNPRLCDMLEFAESELLARSFQDITHPEDLYDDVHMSEEVQLGKLPYYIMTKRYITKTDGVLWAKLRVDRVEQDDGTFCHFLSQISPAVRLSKKQVLESELSGIVTKESRGAKGWILNNLKWMLPLILTGIGSSYALYSDWQTMKATVADLTSHQEQEQ